MAEQRIFIGEIAKQLGVSPKTIRWYEAQGLLPEPSRTDSGYRFYTAEDVERLHFIRKAFAFGFSSKEIKEILDVRSGGGQPCDLVLSILSGKLKAVRKQLRDLKELEQELQNLEQLWRKQSQQPADATVCACIEHTEVSDRRKHG